MIYFLAELLDDRDGGSRAAADCLHDLLDLGQPVVVVSRRRHPLAPRTAGRPSPRVRWLLTPASQPPSRRGLSVSPRKWAWWARETLRHRWKQLRAIVIPRLFPPTVAIHNEFPYPGSFAHGLLRRAPRRMVIVHSSRDCIAYFLRGRKTLTPTSVAAELSQMQGLVFVSPQLRDEWSALADLGRTRRWVLSNTCREDEIADVLAAGRAHLRTSLGVPQEAFVAVCVGWIHDGKGQDTLVAALPDMVRAKPELIVVFVGDDVSEWALRLKEVIREAGLWEHVRFTGSLPSAYQWIHAADLLVHPSRTEGQGLVLLEAMALRTPVLATNVGGIPSTVTHGETGWLVPPDDPAALVNAFRTLSSNGELRGRLVERGEREYWSRFNRAGHRAQFCTIVADMLAQA